MKLALSTFLSLIFCLSSPAQQWCSIAVRTTDARSNAPLSGALVAFVPYGLTQPTDIGGFATWRDQFYPRGREFQVACGAPGYVTQTATFQTPPAPRCGCDDGPALFTYSVALEPVGAPPAGSVGAPVLDEANGYYALRFLGYRMQRCCESTALARVAVQGGVPAGICDWTGPNRQTRYQSLASPIAAMDQGAVLLRSWGWLIDSNQQRATNALAVEAKIGDKLFASTLCGDISIRYVSAVVRWELVWVIGGVDHDVMPFDLVAPLGVCTSAANLHLCAMQARFDDCGRMMLP